ncbi:MAG: pilus assembly protein [Hyphomicrobium sp.]|nr:pilus assembly protein [Hyphomicrobium sp.]
MRGLRAIVSTFRDDDRGSVSILFGISCIVLFGLIGLAIDSSRYYNYTDRLQAALDAAALAGAKLLPDETLNDEDIAAVVAANFASAMAMTGVKAKSLDTPTVKIDRSMNTVEVIGKAKLGATITPVIAPQDDVDVIRTSKVVFDMKKIELAMVLDITGSMNTNNKLADMKAAAKDVVDELYNGALNEDAVRIALAPYSASVNAGALAPSVTEVPPATNCYKSNYRWTCTNAAGANQDTCVIERQGSNAATDAPPVGADKLPNVPTTPYGNYVCPGATVLGLQGKSQKDIVNSTIDSYSASGATAGHIGSAWGWYLLSPQWASVLGSSAPGDYEDKEIRKHMIIMSDGEFNTSYLTGGNTSAATQSDESYAQFRSLCDGIKGKGITIYTVGFDLTNARALSELEACASGTSNFFDAKTGAQLKQSFKDIAKKLNTLRLAS